MAPMVKISSNALIKAPLSLRRDDSAQVVINLVGTCIKAGLENEVIQQDNRGQIENIIVANRRGRTCPRMIQP